MPWSCRLVHEVGKFHQVIWTQMEGEHCHSYRREITEEEYGRPDKFDYFRGGVHTCESCGKSFDGMSPGFSEQPVWDEAGKELQIGDMYVSKEEYMVRPSPNYIRDWKGRRGPIYVKTPAGIWCVDQDSIVKGVWQNSGWTVTGEAPDITAHPSINFPGRYHGWLKNGVLSDDVEGRKF